MITAILLQIGGGGIGGFVPIILIIVVMYFFMIRPQMKKQKDTKKYIDELKKGDRVITTAGIHGKIADITDAYFLIEVDNGVKIRFDRSAISLDASKALNTPPPATKS